MARASFSGQSAKNSDAALPSDRRRVGLPTPKQRTQPSGSPGPPKDA
jgi:hypothetical protein